MKTPAGNNVVRLFAGARPRSDAVAADIVCDRGAVRQVDTKISRIMRPSSADPRLSVFASNGTHISAAAWNRARPADQW